MITSCTVCVLEQIGTSPLFRSASVNPMSKKACPMSGTNALYEFRHTRSGDLRNRDALSVVLRGCGVDPDAVFSEVDSGRPLATIRDEHTSYARSHDVWGVPVFIMGDAAVFVRLLDRPDGDEALAQHTVERVLDLIQWENLNEFKHTSVPR
jgi:hypothetical protein